MVAGVEGEAPDAYGRARASRRRRAPPLTLPRARAGGFRRALRRPARLGFLVPRFDSDSLRASSPPYLCMVVGGFVQGLATSAGTMGWRPSPRCLGSGQAPKATACNALFLPLSGMNYIDLRGAYWGFWDPMCWAC